MTFKGTLYPYQEEALEVMAESNTLLAFDMGCGKTITTLAAIEELREEQPLSVLVLTPNSVKWQWAHEITKFTDQEATVIDGTPAQRVTTYRNMPTPVPYLVMTYGTFMRDFDKLPTLHVIVLDEATAIKSFKSQRSKRVKKIAKNVPIRFALTGTPIENGKLEELFSIMEFVNPKVLGKWWTFESTHVVRNQMGWVERYKNVDQFYTKISQSTVRRTHDDPEVAKYLPTVIAPDPIVVPFRRYAQNLYDRVEAEVLSDLDAMVESMGRWYPVNVAAEYAAVPTISTRPERDRGALMSKITVLRMLADHPDVVRMSGLRANGSKYARHLLQDGQLDRPVQEGSAKLDAMTEYVTDFLDISDRNKVVIFSTYVDMLPKIQEALGSYRCVLFHGGLPDKERDTVKAQFQTDRATRVFISSDAGGYGVDLPQANLLVNYDQPWQAGMAKQRNARIRRAASTWTNVTVQDFLTAGSIEERIWRMVGHKQAVSAAAIDGRGITKDGEIASTLDSLRTFLKERVESAT